MEIKQKLLEKIASTDDENLLMLLDADYDYFIHHEKKDFTDELSKEDLEELKDLAGEPNDKDVLTQNELDEMLKKWRTK